MVRRRRSASSGPSNSTPSEKQPILLLVPCLCYPRPSPPLRPSIPSETSQ